MGCQTSNTSCSTVTSAATVAVKSLDAALEASLGTSLLAAVIKLCMRAIEYWSDRGDLRVWLQHLQRLLQWIEEAVLQAAQKEDGKEKGEEILRIIEEDLKKIEESLQSAMQQAQQLLQPAKVVQDLKDAFARLRSTMLMHEVFQTLRINDALEALKAELLDIKGLLLGADRPQGPASEATTHTGTDSPSCCSALPSTFEVCLPSKGRTSFGIVVQPSKTGDHLHIRQLGGALAEWNRANPKLQVSEGDRIVAVRGKTAHALVEAFLEAMQDREDLKLTIQKKGPGMMQVLEVHKTADGYFGLHVQKSSDGHLIVVDVSPNWQSEDKPNVVTRIAQVDSKPLTTCDLLEFISQLKTKDKVLLGLWLPLSGELQPEPGSVPRLV
mmetsp:Transcript_10635/g.24188  ORF Transcript_10635/g.24188 Transcript_10635/m.24188 type:complete len:383 (+) Transcript_10635:67-1215(+)